MKLLLALAIFISLSKCVYSQADSEILFQYSGDAVTIRKMGENAPMWYSEKNDKILFEKQEMTDNLDTIYLIKSKVTIFSAKLFESDSKSQINIRIDYFYKKTINGKVEERKIDNWGKSYYPAIQKIVNLVDTRNMDNKVTYTMADKSQWIVQGGKNGEQTIFYVTNKDLNYSNFSLMLSNCKTVMVNGKK
jgi:hypothetical protein